MAQRPVRWEEAGSDVIQVGSPPPDDETRRRRRLVAAASLAAVLLAIVTVLALVRSAPHPSAGPGRLGPSPQADRRGSSSTERVPFPTVPAADLHANGALFGFGGGGVVHLPD